MDDTARSRLRRQRSLSPVRGLRETHAAPSSKPSRMMAIGSFFLPSMFKFRVQDKSDATAKRKYQVNVPTRLLTILGFVFLLIPVLIFLYKEAHINDGKHEAHYHAEKFVNVDKREVMAHFLDNHTEHSSNDEDVQKPHSNSTKSGLRHSSGHSHNTTLSSTEER